MSSLVECSYVIKRVSSKNQRRINILETRVSIFCKVLFGDFVESRESTSHLFPGNVVIQLINVYNICQSIQEKKSIFLNHTACALFTNTVEPMYNQFV